MLVEPGEMAFVGVRLLAVYRVLTGVTLVRESDSPEPPHID